MLGFVEESKQVVALTPKPSSLIGAFLKICLFNIISAVMAEQSSKLDVSKSDRKLWLVKVPAFIANLWRPACESSFEVAADSAESAASLGKVTIVDNKIQLQLATDNPGIPTQWRLQDSKDLVPINVLSVQGSDERDSSYRIEGVIDHKFDLLPLNNATGADGPVCIDPVYQKLSKDRTQKAMVKLRTVQLIEDEKVARMSALPGRYVANVGNKRRVERQQKQENKRVRKERDDLISELFGLFEKQAHWNFSQLQTETNQPGTFLKEVLNDIAVLNKKGPHRDLYELKRDYHRT